MDGRRVTGPLKWHGGKSYLANWIHSQAPPPGTYTHRNIVFAGGLGEFWNWHCDDVSETVNDMNGELVNMYRVLRDDEQFAEFRRTVELLPFGNELWLEPPVGRNGAHENERLNPNGKKIKSRPGNAWWSASDVRRAAWFFGRMRTSRQGLGRDYATPTSRLRRGMNEGVSAYLSAVDGLDACHERLRRVEIVQMPAVKFLRVYDHPRAFFYLDPPYLHRTRVAKDARGCEMSEDDHVDLLEALARLKGKFLLSGYPSDLYDSYAAHHKWQRAEKEIDNKASSAETKPKKIEVLWRNY